MKVFYYYLTFYDPENKPYIEFYFAFVGTSVKYKIDETTGLYRSMINMNIKIYKNDTSMFYQKYHISSPLLNDTLNLTSYIFVERIYIMPGRYMAIYEITDSLNKTDMLIFSDSLYVDNFDVNNIFFSDIQPIERFEKSDKISILNKSGYLVNPYVSDFYPEKTNILAAYVEVYNTLDILGKDKKFAVKYYINKTYSTTPYENYQYVRVFQTQKIVPFFIQFDISNLPSGNYYLTIECLNNENKLLAKRQYYFQRLNNITENRIKANLESLNSEFFTKYSNVDTLKMYLKCLIPIAQSYEIDNLNSAIKSNELKQMQVTFLNFWQQRNFQEPEIEWLKYYEKIKYVNSVYGYKKVLGCLTDRGRIYLKYGAPDQIIESKHEPSAYPYEIWQYYVIKNYRNRHFVFYNPTLAYKEYILLHSDMPGEIYDRNWERRLHSRNNSMYNFDATESDEQFGSRAKENYNK
ncbi:MAG: GWxTD domain-containing protein [Bacteroidales bacterium]|nr:GWxTD domain-containing protein [Bacteroidales bacterium]